MLLGNQLRRRSPKLPDASTPAVALRLRERAEQIIEDKGGRAHLTALMVARIEQYALLEVFHDTWADFFIREGITTRQGRVRSGYGDGYLKTLQVLMRLADLIGVERVERPAYRDTRQWLMEGLDASDGSDTTTQDLESPLPTTNESSGDEDHECKDRGPGPASPHCF